MSDIDQTIEAELAKWPQRKYLQTVPTIEHLATWSIQELRTKAKDNGLPAFINRGALILSLYDYLNPPLAGRHIRR